MILTAPDFQEPKDNLGKFYVRCSRDFSDRDGRHRNRIRKTQGTYNFLQDYFSVGT